MIAKRILEELGIPAGCIPFTPKLAFDGMHVFRVWGAEGVPRNYCQIFVRPIGSESYDEDAVSAINVSDERIAELGGIDALGAMIAEAIARINANA